MGSCLGHCHLSKETFSTGSEEHILSDSSSLQAKEEYNSVFKLDQIPKKSRYKRFKSIFSNVKNKYQTTSTLRLELLEDEWSISEGEGDNLKQTEKIVMPTNVKIKTEKGISTASVNSLDLEWEHLPEMAVFSNNVDKEESKSATSAEGWSRISSADSLEWDAAEVDLKEDFDTETEQLLQEIEMLSSKTLHETQEWAS